MGIGHSTPPAGNSPCGCRGGQGPGTTATQTVGGCGCGAPGSGGAANAAALGQSMLRLAGGFMWMPWRMMQVGLEVVARGAEEARQLSQPGQAGPRPDVPRQPAPGPWPTTPYGPPPGVPAPPPPVAPAAIPQPTPVAIPQPTPVAIPQPAPVPQAQQITPVSTPTGASVQPDVVTQTTPMEDKKMSCCDQDLSGCDLKIVQYTIVSIDPFISDDERILDGPAAIAISDDLDEGDLKARVLSNYYEKHKNCEHSRDEKSQYLRVCYHVECRFDSSCDDYEKSQAKSLQDINATLEKILKK